MSASGLLIDGLILAFAISSFYRGRTLGFVRQICAAIGFFGGLFFGAWLQPHVAQHIEGDLNRAVATLSCTIGFAFVFLLFGEAAGLYAKNKLKVRPVDHYDNALGSVVNILSMLVSTWLLAAVITALPLPNIRVMLQDSYIIRGLNSALPAAPHVIANIGHLIDPNGFPQVFIGNEPQPGRLANLPPLGDFKAVVASSRNSVVKIEGLGCGGVIDGSGFIVGPDLIATNAHVVAGIKHPYVTDQNGTHRAATVFFDPNKDFAVLRAKGLTGKQLSLAGETIKNDTPAVTLGYPGGGDFTAGPAVVLDSILARGRNIYNQGISVRQVYELTADVAPGNSGGPLITRDGKVVGVVFAESTTYQHIGYALTTPSLQKSIVQASSTNQPVNTGLCAAE
jgi:S1-C subfamily serine protease